MDSLAPGQLLNQQMKNLLSLLHVTLPFKSINLKRSRGHIFKDNERSERRKDTLSTQLYHLLAV